MTVQGSDLRVILAKFIRIYCRENAHTLLPFSIRARSQIDTSAANLLNSRTLFSRSAVHLLTISSRDFPLSIDGGGTAIAEEVVGAALVAGAAVSFLSPSFEAKDNKN